MEKGTRMFRKSVRGFNREDVNSYIVSTSNEFSAREERLNSEISSLRRKLSVSAERLNEAKNEAQASNELKARLREAEERLSAFENELADARSRADDLTSQLRETEGLLSAANAENKSLSERLRTLEETLSKTNKADSSADSEPAAAKESSAGSTALSSEDCDKVRLYDEMSRNVGDILLNANMNAERIVRDARLQADGIAVDGAERAEAARRQLTVVTGRTVAALKKNAIRNADCCIREFKLYSDSISQSTQGLSAELEQKFAALNARMEALGNELEDGIKTVMRDFDRKCNTIKSTIAAENEKQ